MEVQTFLRFRFIRSSHVSCLSSSLRPLSAVLCLLSFRLVPLACAAAEPVPDGGSGWKVLPICGGGYVQGVEFCPSDANRLYAYVDVGGPYRSDDGGRHWAPLHGNLSLALREREIDLVRGVSVDPRDADRLVIVGGGGGGATKGGVAVTRDGGRTWRDVLSACFYGNGRRRMLGRTLDRDPFDPDRLVAGEDWDGLFVSRDGGETWRRTGPERHWFTDVRYDRTVPGRVYASAPPVAPKLLGYWKFTEEMRKTPRETGFYRSDDGGEMWRKVSDEAPDEIVQVAGSSALVGIFDKRLVQVSRDGGATWADFSDGLPPAVAEGGPGYPKKGRRYALAAGRGFWVLGDSSGLFFRRGLSDAAWTELPPPRCVSGNLAKEPRIAQIQARGEAVTMPALGSVAVDPADDAHWFATDWFDLWESVDAGTNWTSRVDGMMQLCSFTVEVDPFDRRTIAYGVADLGSYVSNDGGMSFRAYDPCYWSSIAFSSVTPGVVMGVGGKATREINVSTDHGRTWRRASAKGLPAWTWGKVAPYAANTVAVRPDRDEFWICVGGPIAPGKGGPYVSTDLGETWTWAGEGLPADEREFVYGRTEWERRTLSELVFSTDGSAITASSYGACDYWRLAPGARVWTKTGGRRDVWDRHSLVADPHTPGRYVSGGARPSESLDGGQTWHPLAGLSERADFVCFDRFRKGLVVAACVREIKVSMDGGQTFRTFERGYPLPTGNSRQLQVFDGKIYFLTGGSGVFVKEVRGE